MNDQPKWVYERRKGPDFWTQWVKISGYIAWAIVLLIISITDNAKPRVETLFDRLLNVKLDPKWNIILLEYAFYLLVGLFILCNTTLIINIKRHKRKTDKYNPSIIILTVTSLIGIILFILLIPLKCIS